jgi:hypothetical protein
VAEMKKGILKEEVTNAYLQSGFFAFCTSKKRTDLYFFSFTASFLGIFLGSSRHMPF